MAVCDRAPEVAAVADRCAERRGAAPVGVLDVRDAAAQAAWIAEVADALGGIDVVVANAGGGRRAPRCGAQGARRAGGGELHERRRPDPAGRTPHAAPAGPRAGGGSITVITSIEAHRAAPGFAVYAAMKSAVANLAMTLALELADRHVRANAIAPDMIPTPGIGPIDVTTPLPYAGDPDDVAAAAVYLASDAAAFVTGTTVHVDGGTRPPAAGAGPTAAAGARDRYDDRPSGTRHG
ncbi:MAG: SDR family oxidoreductase [Acidimicrobiales bacterium]